ncbi:hypothetical protein TNCV_3312101 [Trichonephila clavipes]|nr:hypothetical protein TNCV_3312101 [Trichonephila clavipes]
MQDLAVTGQQQRRKAHDNMKPLNRAGPLFEWLTEKGCDVRRHTCETLFHLLFSQGNGKKLSLECLDV